MISAEFNFQQAMQASMHWCQAWDTGELSDEIVADRVAQLLVSRDGVRGFFAISLSSDTPLMDRLPDPLMMAFINAGEIVVDITVRNLAMSTAMAIVHQRSNNYEKEGQSLRVRDRCKELLRRLDTFIVKNHLEWLNASIDGKGNYVEFLSRWGYDKEQKAAIRSAIYLIPET